MTALLTADLALLEQAHRQIEGRIGTQRLRDAQAALAAKHNGPAQSSTTATQSDQDDGLSASEAEQMAFLRNTGAVASHGASPTTLRGASPQSTHDGLSASEAEQMAFLAQAGAVPSRQQQSDDAAIIGRALLRQEFKS